MLGSCVISDALTDTFIKTVLLHGEIYPVLVLTIL